jgi:hypothetical protein
MTHARSRRIGARRHHGAGERSRAARQDADTLAAVLAIPRCPECKFPRRLSDGYQGHHPDCRLPERPEEKAE